MNHEKIENLNRLIINKKIKPVIQDLPKKKNPEPDGFAGEFYQSFKEWLTQILHNSSIKKWRERNSHRITLWSQFYPDAKAR